MRLFLIFNNFLMWSQISFNHQVYLQMQMKTRVQMFEKQKQDGMSLSVCLQPGSRLTMWPLTRTSRLNSSLIPGCLVIKTGWKGSEKTTPPNEWVNHKHSSKLFRKRWGVESGFTTQQFIKKKKGDECISQSLKLLTRQNAKSVTMMIRLSLFSSNICTRRHFAWKLATFSRTPCAPQPVTGSLRCICQYNSPAPCNIKPRDGCVWLAGRDPMKTLVFCKGYLARYGHPQ